MKNREKFRDEILNFANNSVGGNDEPYCEFARKNMIPSITNCTNGECAGFTCSCCRAIFAFWLDEEYEEPSIPEADWSKVPVDTLVRVRDFYNEVWSLRYFKGIDDNDPEFRFLAWDDGATSITACGNYTHWKYCELVEEEYDCE